MGRFCLSFCKTQYVPQSRITYESNVKCVSLHFCCMIYVCLICERSSVRVKYLFIPWFLLWTNSSGPSSFEPTPYESASSMVSKLVAIYIYIYTWKYGSCFCFFLKLVGFPYGQVEVVYIYRFHWVYWYELLIHNFVLSLHHSIMSVSRAKKGHADPIRSLWQCIVMRWTQQAVATFGCSPYENTCKCNLSMGPS